MPLGDSITEGVNGGYRVGLWRRLRADGFTIDYVGSQHDEYAAIPDQDHEGHPGFTVGDIMDEAEAWIAESKPDYILLLAGTNDLAWWNVEGPDVTAERFGALLDLIHAAAPEVQVIVGSLPPMEGENEQGDARATLVEAYNAAIADHVRVRAANGMRVSFADLNAVLSVADLYDGIHPDEAGYEKIAEEWYRALTALPGF
ncbi:MAG: SGNH hydrolase [Chloroflexi bacterium]|nr:SGNH hydrolase [Chloroflexota bacterium]